MLHLNFCDICKGARHLTNVNFWLWIEKGRWPFPWSPYSKVSNRALLFWIPASALGPLSRSVSRAWVNGSFLPRFSKRLLCGRHSAGHSSIGPPIMSGFYCIPLDAGTREKVSNVREVVEVTRGLCTVGHSQSCVNTLFKRFLRDSIAVFYIKRASGQQDTKSLGHYIVSKHFHWYIMPRGEEVHDYI